MNAITGEYATYLAAGIVPAGASPEAAAIAAAHRALTRLFGAQAANFESERLDSLADCSLDSGDPGSAVGVAAANAIVDLRSSDGAAQANFPYVAPGAGLPGVWVPVGPAPIVAPGWGNVAPWVLNSGDQFRPDAPPALDSGRYARDFSSGTGPLNSVERTLKQCDCPVLERLPWRFGTASRRVIEQRALDLSATDARADVSRRPTRASRALTPSTITQRPITAIRRATETATMRRPGDCGNADSHASASDIVGARRTAARWASCCGCCLATAGLLIF